MKKKRQTKNKKTAVLKRGAKRNARLRKTQSQKNEKKLVIIEDKKRLKEKQDEEIRKIMQSRNLRTA